MKVVTVTTQFVVTPVASVSLPFGSDVHYFVFTVLTCHPDPES